MGKLNNYQIAGDTRITTTGNIDDLDFKGYSCLQMNNATDATIRGIRAGYDGQVVTIVSIGAGDVYLAHQNAGSAAANRLINPVTGMNTPLKAGGGYASYQYERVTARCRLLSHHQGGYISIPHASLTFSTNGATETWTVDAADVETLQYEILDTTAYIVYVINTTTTAVAADATQLKIDGMPVVAAQTSQSLGRYFDANTGIGAPANAVMAPSISSTRLIFIKGDLTAWALVTNGLYLIGEVAIIV